MFLWDVYLVNEKGSSSFNENDLSLFNSGFNISSDGTVQFGREISSRIQCAMDLRIYPHDVQICRMMFTSYQRTEEEMKLKIRVEIWADSLQSSAFLLMNVSSAIETSSVMGELDFSKAVIVIVLQRQLTVYLYQVISQNSIFHFRK